MSSYLTEISFKSKKKRTVTTCFTSILHFHCHAINTAQKLMGNRPVEEAKKMKRYKRPI